MSGLSDAIGGLDDSTRPKSMARTSGLARRTASWKGGVKERLEQISLRWAMAHRGEVYIHVHKLDG